MSRRQRRERGIVSMHDDARARGGAPGDVAEEIVGKMGTPITGSADAEDGGGDQGKDNEGTFHSHKGTQKSLNDFHAPK